MQMKRVVVLAVMACCCATVFSRQGIFVCGTEYGNVDDGDAARAEWFLSKGCAPVSSNNDVSEGAPPVPEFANEVARSAYLRWSAAISDGLRHVITVETARSEFVQLVWFESQRQKTDPGVVLALIEQSSNFNRFYRGANDSRGLLAVPARWAKRIGNGDETLLFHEQTNLRYGTVIRAHYAAEANGDMQHVAIAATWPTAGA